MYGGDVAQGIAALENGDSALVGTCKSFDAQRTDICVTRMSAKGEMLWCLLLGGGKEDDGSIVVVGGSDSYSRTTKFYMLKIGKH